MTGMVELPASAERLEKPGAILFMCGWNVIRAPMAEVIAKRLLPPDVYIQSAGVRAGERDPFVDAVLDEVGLSLARHHPRTMEDLEDDFFDLIITLTPEAHHAALELTRSQAVTVVYWPTMDPTAATGTREQVLSAYREVREHLWKRIDEHFEGISRRPAQTA